MDPTVTALHKAVQRWDERGLKRPQVLVISGSGLAVDLGKSISDRMPLSDFATFEVHGIEGHPLTLELLEPTPERLVLYQRGRLHSYQGFSAGETVFSVRLAALLGATVLIMTNAAGGLLASQQAGDLVLLRDHINLTGLNPLRGSWPPEWGPQFPDMTNAYDPKLGELIAERAGGLGIELQPGVYAGVAGPSYETPAETRMLAEMGADVVGMSTVLGVIAAHHMGLRCAAISLVCNPAAGVGDQELVHQDVLEAAKSAAGKVQTLLQAVLNDPRLL